MEKDKVNVKVEYDFMPKGRNRKKRVIEDFDALHGEYKKHELLDDVPRKSIKEQVELFVNAGVRLEESRRQMMLGLSDEDIPEDLDELQTPLDDKDADLKTVSDAMAVQQLKANAVRKAQAKKQKAEQQKADTKANAEIKQDPNTVSPQT